MRELAQTLEDIAVFIRRYVVLNGAQATACALWVAHTHSLEAADSTPYVAVTSAEMRSGKTRLLEVLELLVREPLPTSNISDAALFRAVAELSPTLLLDEVDAIFGPKARDREDLRGMLNAGYRRGVVVRRMGGSKMTTLESFPVFCAKCFAGIGKLPNTVADRAIPVRLKRRTATEKVERFRRREADVLAEPIRQSIESLAAHHVNTLRESRPMLPDELSDRAQDVWEPLLAIADLAEGIWPAQARLAAVELSSAQDPQDDSIGVMLLGDIRTMFVEIDADRISSADLVSRLNEFNEAPWSEWKKGRGLTQNSLASMLRRFSILSRSVRLSDGSTPKGFKREQFEDAWARYLVPAPHSQSATEPQPASTNGFHAISDRHTADLVALVNDGAIPLEQTAVALLHSDEPVTERGLA